MVDDNNQFVSDKSSFTDSNYEIMLNLSLKSYCVEKEIEKIKRSLEVLKGTKV